MKYFLTAFLAFTVLMSVYTQESVISGGDGTAADNGKKRTWRVTGKVNMEGYLDLQTTDQKKDPTVVWEKPGDLSDKISGNIDVIYEKQITGGTYTAKIGVDFFSGLNAELLWDVEMMDGRVDAGISFNRDNWWDERWPAIILSAGFDNGNFGIKAAGLNNYWAEAKLTEWVLLYFRRQPNRQTWDYRNNEAYPDPALIIYELNGYYLTLNDQLMIDLCYKQQPNREYRDYFRASSIVARNWNAGNQTIGISYKPDFLDYKLNAGVAFTQIALPSTALANPKEEVNSLKPDREADPKYFGALSRVVFGAIYDMGDLAVSAMVNLGKTAGSSWWFLTKDTFDREMEDGYFDLLGADPYRTVVSEMGVNVGARAKIGDNFSVNGDVEVIGLHDMEKEGMMAAGLRGVYQTQLLTAGLTARVFHYLGAPSANIIEGGVFGVHPSVYYGVVPDILVAGLRVDFVSGISGEEISKFRFVKFNPKLNWTVNADKRTNIEVGYIFRYDFNEYRQEASENAVNMKLTWRF
jgi:hypothetical protein